MRMQAFKERFYMLLSDAADRLRPPRSIYASRKIARPAGSRILVLAPHFDDDIIGCGGTLCKHRRDKDKISIVYFTDGKDKYQAKNNPAISQVRKDEAKKAAGILGIEDLIFFDFPEQTFTLTKAGIEKLEAVLEKKNPDLVYLPWFLDGHVQHLLVNKIFLKAFKHRRLHFNCCAYEVWTPLIPNIIVDITEYAGLKKKALKQYASQIEITDYSKAILGLNSYRAITPMYGRGYAEAFIYLSGRGYIRLIERYSK